MLSDTQRFLDALAAKRAALQELAARQHGGAAAADIHQASWAADRACAGVRAAWPAVEPIALRSPSLSAIRTLVDEERPRAEDWDRAADALAFVAVAEPGEPVLVDGVHKVGGKNWLLIHAGARCMVSETEARLLTELADLSAVDVNAVARKVWGGYKHISTIHQACSRLNQKLNSAGIGIFLSVRERGTQIVKDVATVPHP